jgi:hypothetical protein
MTTTPKTEPTYHVLLIGIDAYAVKPLRGCVNDIDDMQRLLLGPRVRIPEASITRLASPHAGTAHEALEGDRPATLANIREELTKLGARPLEGDHRVLIYYSGHGTRAPVSTPAGPLHREALVPVDFNAQPGHYQLLFDLELNALLADIAARTPAVTVILDCCHSAGATRELPGADMTSRVLELGRQDPLTLPADLQARALVTARGTAGNVDDCHVVAACLNHELAQESSDSQGTRHGLLTRALLEQLRAVPEKEDLRATPWGRIWQAVRAEVDAANPTQHVWMAGSESRAVLAGPRVDGDLGLTVTRTGPNTYAIDAGALVGVTEGGQVAVYGLQPASFPPLGSQKDDEARLSGMLLDVTSASPATATAKAAGTPFDLPPGARGRLVKAGSPARLRCAVVPANPAIAATLATSALLEVVGEGQAHALLRKRLDADVWDLVDDIHGAKVGYPVLCSLSPHQLDLAARVMEQYFYYALPLRMASACKDLPGALALSVLRCPSGRELTADEKSGVGLPEVGSEGAFAYDLHRGDLVAMRIRNTSGERLKVSLLNAAASGRVEYLGDQMIDPQAVYVFWRGNTQGRPFPASTPQGATQGIDRLVAIGTTVERTDLRYLKVNSKFAEILARTRGQADKDLDDEETASPPPEQWTATQAVMRCQA